MNIATGEKAGFFTLKDASDIKNFKTFGAKTKEDYEKKLKSMNLADIHVEAIKHGLRPMCHRGTMIASLLKQFTKAEALFNSAFGKTKS